MTYSLSSRLFLENGPAARSADVRSRRNAAADFYLAERARLDAARKVIGTELKIAA
jgi:hypothetical protein